MPSRILQIGFIRSGNYWLWKTLHTICKLAGLERKSFIKKQPLYSIARNLELLFPEEAEIDFLEIFPKSCFYIIPPFLRMPIEDIGTYLNETTHVWTHSELNEDSDKIFSKFDKIIYIIRDPRDVLISKREYRKTLFLRKLSPFEPETQTEYLEKHLASHLRLWGGHVARYLLARKQFNIFFIFYERLRYAWDEEVSRLLDYLGITLDPHSLQLLKEETSFDQMKSRSPYHLNRGKWGEWQKAFREQEKKVARGIVGPLLQLLNYPFDGEISSQGFLPAVPENSDKAIQSFLTHLGRRTLREKIGFINRILKNWKNYF